MVSGMAPAWVEDEVRGGQTEATFDSAPRSKAVGTPRRQGLCSHLAHLWATSDFAPRSEAVGTPQAAGVM